MIAADAGKEIDRLSAQARDGTHKVDQKLEEYRQRVEKNIDQGIKKTGTELNKAVDAFDKNVSEVSPWMTLHRIDEMNADNSCRAPTRPRAGSPAGLAAASKFVSVLMNRFHERTRLNGCNDMATNQYRTHN